MPVSRLERLLRYARRSPDEAHARNMLLLTQLRTLAILGQLAAIVMASVWLGAQLPVLAMSLVLGVLVLLNFGTLVWLRHRRAIPHYPLFLALLVDWAALTTQLYLSGGASNPFASIGVLQVVLGAVLLYPWSSWALLVLHSLSLGVLAFVHRPLILAEPFESHLSPVHVFAGWLNFVLVSILIVLFTVRIVRNIRQRNRRLAEMRQREAEESHIVRMGLLASGAAHELGTPLASMAVILGDWTKDDRLMADGAMAEEIREMQAAVARCKAIIGGVLYASGEVRSESVARTSLAAFIAEVARDWDRQRPGMLMLEHGLDRPLGIVADQTLAQVLVNMLDNAVEAGATQIVLRADIDGGELRLSVRDNGPGFAPGMLAAIGKPYSSTKDRLGAGLGLFLAVNVMRKLGGAVRATNLPEGGAQVMLAIPLHVLQIENAHV